MSLEVWRDGQFFPDLMVQQGRAFMRRHKDGPFFLYRAVNVPHDPLQGADKWRRIYADLPAPRRMYAAFISTMDKAIGQLLDALDELGSSRIGIRISPWNSRSRK